MSSFVSYLLAFAVGGAFCAVAQVLLDLTRLTPARILVLYVVAGVALGALGVFDPLVDLAGAGATVPLVGFGGTVAKGVKEAIDEQGPLGILTGPLTAASGGTTAALVFGYVVALLFRGKPKRISRA